MNLQQLRYLCGIADHELNLSKAAQALHTSQPGISRQIRLLEEELRTDLLVRQGNRITALTEPGRGALEIARRILRDIDNLRGVGADHAGDDTGSLVVATTHVHARYILMPVVRKFRERYPGVDLSLRQGNPDQIVQWVDNGGADLGLCTAPSLPTPSLVQLPCYSFRRGVLVPRGHPLLRKAKRITLTDMARYPMINLDNAFAGGIAVMSAFASKNLTPNVALTATDADVIKAYVAAGMGIATVPEVAFNAKRDTQLRLIDARHLFQPSISYVWLHRHHYLRGYTSEFIRMLSSAWTRAMVDHAMRSGEAPNPAMAVEPAAEET